MNIKCNIHNQVQRTCVKVEAAQRLETNSQEISSSNALLMKIVWYELYSTYIDTITDTIRTQKYI